MFQRKKKTIRDPKTLEKCTSCGNVHQRDFLKGDVIFSECGVCTMCKKPMRIERIFAQIREP